MKTNNKYLTYKKKGKSKYNINPQFFKRNINEAKKLYNPEYGDINKPKIQIQKIKENNYNISSTKNYLQFKQVLNNYMNDYEKLRKQNKIPKYTENYNYNFQEFEAKKNYVKDLFDSFMDLNGREINGHGGLRSALRYLKDSMLNMLIMLYVILRVLRSI